MPVRFVTAGNVLLQETRPPSAGRAPPREDEGPCTGHVLSSAGRKPRRAQRPLASHPVTRLHWAKAEPPGYGPSGSCCPPRPPCPQSPRPPTPTSSRAPRRSPGEAVETWAQTPEGSSVRAGAPAGAARRQALGTHFPRGAPLEPGGSRRGAQPRPAGPGRYSRMSAHSSWGSFLERVASTCLPTSSKTTGLASRFIMSMDVSCVLARASSTWGAPSVSRGSAGRRQPRPASSPAGPRLARPTERSERPSGSRVCQAARAGAAPTPQRPGPRAGRTSKSQEHRWSAGPGLHPTRDTRDAGPAPWETPRGTSPGHRPRRSGLTEHAANAATPAGHAPGAQPGAGDRQTPGRRVSVCLPGQTLLTEAEPLTFTAANPLRLKLLSR